MKFSGIMLGLIIIALSVSCGGRLPSAKTAHSLTEHHFHRYGKKYKDSIFGKVAMDKIEVNRVSELSKNLAEIESYINFRSGNVGRVLVTTRKKPPLGWKVESWEMYDFR